MCEAQNFSELKLELVQVNEEAKDFIEGWRNHFEWLKSLDKGIPKIKTEYIRLCRCGSQLTKNNGFLICRDCGFKNEFYLICPKCKHNKGFKLNKKYNKCLTCGHTWNRKLKHYKIINKAINRIKREINRVYIYFLRTIINPVHKYLARIYLKDYYERKKEKALMKIDIAQKKFEMRCEQAIKYREKFYREKLILGEKILE